MTTGDDDYARWLREHPWPELQDLIDRFGGYSKITAEAWAEYDEAVRQWQELRQKRYPSRG